MFLGDIPEGISLLDNVEDLFFFLSSRGFIQCFGRAAEPNFELVAGPQLLFRVEIIPATDGADVDPQFR